MMEAVTGTLLLFYYEPGEKAFASLGVIANLTPYGNLIRGLHFWAAQIMVITVLLHMGRVVWHQAYRPPRQMHRLTTQIPYTQCNQCHNVGLPDLYHMVFKPRSDLGEVEALPPEKADDYAARLRYVYQPGMVFTSCEVKLDCIDCHTRQEIMGDGHLYASEYDALKLQCLDCHGTQTEKPRAWTVTLQDDLAFEEKINPVFPTLLIGDKILQTRTGEELPWVRFENNRLFLYRKLDGQKYEIPLVEGSKCRQEADKQTSNDCHKCHDVSGNLHPSS